MTPNNYVFYGAVFVGGCVIACLIAYLVVFCVAYLGYLTWKEPVEGKVLTLKNTLLGLLILCGCCGALSIVYTVLFFIGKLVVYLF